MARTSRALPEKIVLEQLDRSETRFRRGGKLHVQRPAEADCRDRPRNHYFLQFYK
jgi:hypothetical protein